MNDLLDRDDHYSSDSKSIRTDQGKERQDVFTF